MKKLFRFVLTLSVLLGIGSGQFVYAYDADGNPNVKREIAGGLATQAYREYQLVRFALTGASTAPLTAGDVVVGDCVSDDGITVAVPGSTNSADAVRGVVVSATINTCDVSGSTPTTDFGRRNWGYIQVKGLCTVCNLNTAGIPAGSSIVCAASTKYGTTPVAGNTGQKTLGFCYNTSTNGSANTVDINI